MERSRCLHECAHAAGPGGGPVAHQQPISAAILIRTRSPLALASGFNANGPGRLCGRRLQSGFLPQQLQERPRGAVERLAAAVDDAERADQGAARDGLRSTRTGMMLMLEPSTFDQQLRLRHTAGQPPVAPAGRGRSYRHRAAEPISPTGEEPTALCLN
jgi:hypothetical protein